MTQEEATIRSKLQNAMTTRNSSERISSDILESATAFLHDVLRPDIVGRYRNNIPILFKTPYENFSLNFSIRKIHPSKSETVSAAEGLIQASQYATDTYVDQRQFQYKDLKDKATEQAVACFSMLIDIDNIPEIYNEMTDESKMQLLYETYPLMSTILRPTYIILSGKKGIHLIYCFNQNLCNKSFSRSYPVLQKALITYFDGDPKRMGMNVIRMPFTNRIDTDYGCGAHCEDPRILYRRPDGSYDYGTFCTESMECLVHEEVLDRVVPPAETKTAKSARLYTSSAQVSSTKASNGLTRWNSNRIFDIETIVKLRHGHVEDIRDFLLFMYCSAMWNITPLDKDGQSAARVEKAVKDLNSTFTIPGPQPETDIRALIRYGLKCKQTKKYCYSYSDEFMYQILGITESELPYLRNCYTDEEKKLRSAAYMRDYRKSKGKHKGPQKVICKYIGIVSRGICEGLSIKFLTDNKIARSTGYKLMRLLQGWKKSASGLSESEYHNFCTNNIDPELSGMDRLMSDSFESLFFHYTAGDCDDWLRSTEGSRTYDILQGRMPASTDCRPSESSVDQFTTMLQSYGVTDDSIAAFRKVHKKSSYKYICAHPYSGLKYGISIRACDSIAYSNGVPSLSDERIDALTGYMLTKNIQDGNTRIRPGYLVGKVSALSEFSSYKCGLPSDRILKSALANHSYRIIDGYLTSVDDHDIEQYIAKRLVELDSANRTYNVSSALLNKVKSSIGFHLSAEQRSIVKNVLCSSGIYVISGGPGTGKTSMIRAVFEGYHALHKTSGIVLCAQSGKAAVNLSKNTGHDGTTIHKLLRLRPGELSKAQLDKHGHIAINAGLIVIDECSLVDIKLFYQLLKSIEPSTTIVLCGDPEQLPSVDEGNVMHDIISSGRFRHFKLTENFRQKDQNDLMANIARIHNGDMPVACDNFDLIKASTDKDVFDRVMSIVRNSDMSRTQILSPMYDGAAGIHAINDAVRRLYGRDMSRPVSEGDYVMFTNSSYNYVNGQTGTVLSANNFQIKILIDGGKAPVTIYPDQFGDVVPAYACSIHKSQGSEYDHVIICLPENAGIMMQRSLLYTAVTRARKKVIIIYTGNTLTQSLSTVGHRDTWLGDMLCKTPSAGKAA